MKKDTIKKLNKTRQEIIFNLQLIKGICEAESDNNDLVEELKSMENNLQQDLQEIEQDIFELNHNLLKSQFTFRML